MLRAQVDCSYNLVDEDDDLILQRFSCVDELPDPADRVDDLYLLSWQRQVHSNVSLRERFRNDASPEFTISSLQKRANLEYRLLEHFCLHLIRVLFD